MDPKLATVAEALAYEFAELCDGPARVVLATCVDEFPDQDQYFVEQAARARLTLLRQPPTSWETPVRDFLDVSLHDGELAGEVELMTRLMVAANESKHALAQEEVDRILSEPGDLELQAVPHQRVPVGESWM